MAGFLVGMAAGAVGMYLFGTDEGEKLRRDVSQYWKEAAGDLLAEGVIQDAQKDIGTVFKEILTQASQNIDQHTLAVSGAGKAPKREKSHKMLFKGV